MKITPVLDLKKEVGINTAENDPCKVCPLALLYRYDTAENGPSKVWATDVQTYR